jgi:hypothetical protein
MLTNTVCSVLRIHFDSNAAHRKKLVTNQPISNQPEDANTLIKTRDTTYRFHSHKNE